MVCSWSSDYFLDVSQGSSLRCQVVGSFQRSILAGLGSEIEDAILDARKRTVERIVVPASTLLRPGLRRLNDHDLVSGAGVDVRFVGQVIGSVWLPASRQLAPAWSGVSDFLSSLLDANFIDFFTGHCCLACDGCE